MNLESTTGMISFMRRMQQKLRPLYRRRHWGERQLVSDVLRVYRLLTDDGLLESMRGPDGTYDARRLAPLARAWFGHRKKVTEHVLMLLSKAEELSNNQDV